MRIDKLAALSVLSNEVARLTAQAAMCDIQFAKTVSISTPGLEGQGAREFCANVHRYAVVLLSQKFFFQAIANADRQNLVLVAALPTTDGFVLDTDVAQSRIDAAEAEIGRLRAQEEAAIERAQRVNAAIASSSALVAPGLSVAVSFIDIAAIRMYYEALIAAQYAIIEYNRMILACASRYDSQSLSLYQSIDANAINHSTDRMVTLFAGGTWGPMAWGIDFLMRYLGGGGFSDYSGGKIDKAKDRRALWQKFLDGDLEAKNALFSAETSGSTSFLGVDASGSAEAEALGLKASVTPDGEWDLTEGEAHMGVKGELEAYLGRVKAEGDFGLVHGDAEAKLGVVSAEGVLGFSLMQDGRFNPSARAHAKAEATALSGEVNTRVGSEDMNAHAKAEGKLGTASAEVTANFGPEGVQVGGSAEAYGAQGSVSGGVTLFGIKIDVEVEGKAGGAGVSFGAAASENKVSGKIGAGLGLGAGLGISVDWSEFDWNIFGGSHYSGGGGGGGGGGGFFGR